MEPDDYKRNSLGVICTLVVDEHGRARLVMDDGKSQRDVAPQSWRATAIYTRVDFPEKAFLETELTEEQFAEIGFMLVARLAAFETNRRKRESSDE